MTGRRPAQPKRAIMQTNIPANELHRARLIGIVNARSIAPRVTFRIRAKTPSARSILPSNWRPIPSTVMPAAIAFSEPPATQAE